MSGYAIVGGFLLICTGLFGVGLLRTSAREMPADVVGVLV